jgi:hypothetical protein
MVPAVTGWLGLENMYGPSHHTTAGGGFVNPKGEGWQKLVTGSKFAQQRKQCERLLV